MITVRRETSNEADVLTHAGFTVQAQSASLLAVSRGAERWLAHIVRRSTSPTARQIAATDALAAEEVVLFVAPRATQRVRSLISAAPRAWLITHEGDAVLAGGVQPESAPTGAARGRIPWGRYAVMRSLLRTPTPRTQRRLAEETGLTQGAISGALTQLGTLAQRHPQGWIAASAAELWDAFLAGYPGAQGTRTFWYSRAPFNQQSELLRPLTLLSADGAADVLGPWRKPVQLVAYTDSPLDMESLGFSPATASEASVTVSIPKDETVFSTASAWNTGVADTPLAAWDLRAAGGPDTEEAVGRLRETVLRRFER